MNLTIFGQGDYDALGRLFFGFFIVLILAVLSPILCFIIMKRKGYDPIVWVILGLFLHLIALFICLIMPRKETTPIQQQYGQPYEPYQPPYQPEMQQQGVRCNSCGTLNLPIAQHCMYCGEKLS